MRFGIWLESEEVYYYASQVPLQPGQIIRGWDTSQSNRPELKKVEQIFEKVRQNSFPNLPSRIGCVFVSKEPNWKSSHSRPHLYQVSVSGKTFLTDSGWFGEAMWHHKDEDSVVAWANDYWNGKPYLGGKMMKAEIIVQGQVKILSEITI